MYTEYQEILSKRKKKQILVFILQVTVCHLFYVNHYNRLLVYNLTQVNIIVKKEKGNDKKKQFPSILNIKIKY